MDQCQGAKRGNKDCVCAPQMRRQLFAFTCGVKLLYITVLHQVWKPHIRAVKQSRCIFKIKSPSDLWNVTDGMVHWFLESG